MSGALPAFVCSFALLCSVFAFSLRECSLAIRGGLGAGKTVWGSCSVRARATHTSRRGYTDIQTIARAALVAANHLFLAACGRVV